MTCCKNQIVVQILRIVAQWWTFSESHLLRLYFGVFQPSVVSSNMLNAVAQRPYEHSPRQCLRRCQGFHVTWIMVMNIHISTTGSSTSTCDRRAVEQPVCEDDKIYVQHQLCVSGRQALCASRSLMTGLHCGTIVHIIGDEQRTYLVVKGTDWYRALSSSYREQMVDMGTLKYWCCATVEFLYSFALKKSYTPQDYNMYKLAAS